MEQKSDRQERGTLTLLAIDTSSDFVSVGIGSNGEVLSQTIFQKRRSSEELLGEIDKIRRSCPDYFEQLDGVAVAIGPGSFTGVRIGLSLAHGLAYGLKIPIYGISSTLASLFLSPLSPGQQVGMVRARAGEVFCSRFEVIEDDSGRFVISEGDPIQTVPGNIEELVLVPGLLRACELVKSFHGSALHFRRVQAGDPISPLYGKPVQARTLQQRGLSKQN